MWEHSLSVNRTCIKLAWIQPLKSTYEVLIQDLKKVHEVYYHGRGGTDFSWERKMTELVTNIIEFMAAKRDMTELYPAGILCGC